MPYSDFTLVQVKKKFNLFEDRVKLFGNVETIKPSNWLNEALNIGLELALSNSSEKARSEFIVVPILFELERSKTFSIYSGERLDVDKENGLFGECDFILSQGKITNTIQNPIFALLEAKKNDIGSGLGQCTAQMLGARLFNQQENNDIDTIFGCVTTGEIWQFLKLEEDVIHIDSKCYYINDLEMILGIFQNIIDYNNVTKS
ncbi:hypothetical protein QUF74_12570 [Candidatus Halobeggiatoa sp. HSG11]|nr:hypothetical protein [Candidatus Halobeggiatoa sp. HSG11]